MDDLEQKKQQGGDESAKDMPAREQMECDVVIVGAGPAGLAAAIKLKQLAAASEAELSVIVIEKGSEVGAHILSGAVVDPIAIDRLIPDWRDDPDCPLKNPVKDDQFYYLTAKRGLRLPNFIMPKFMANHGNHAVSLGKVCRWLGQKAEELGVEIYPGFAASEALYNDEGRVAGVATGDMGIGADGHKKPIFERGIELVAKYTLLAEGARGSLTKQVINKFHLDEGCDQAKFGLGLKELWEIDSDKHKQGLIQHFMGWPLDNKTGGGGFIYHMTDNKVAVGFVVHLNYTNPYLSPFQEFQKFKTHPLVKDLLKNGKRLAYGARAISEGGWQSVPKVTFPGGAIIGCSAGFLNVPRIKGSHNAMLSGMLAGEKVFAAIKADDKNVDADVINEYERQWRDSDIGKDLKPVRNVKPLWSRFGTIFGMMLGGVDMWTNTLFNFSFFGTLSHNKPDHACLKEANSVQTISYGKADGKLTFDRLSSVYLSNTSHEEDQPSHLKLADAKIPINYNLVHYGEPARLYCPAGVYEVVDEGGDKRFVINAQNCVHCKTCDIKDPTQNINWTVPEGGGGPNYSEM